jgi:cytochrome P450
MALPLATELELPQLAIHDADFQRDPGPFLEAARRRHPWLARYGDTLFVHGYHAIAELSLKDDKLIPAFDGVIDFYGVDPDTPWARFMAENILAISGARHKKIRDSVFNAFTPRTVNRFREVMRQNIIGLLDQWAPLGRFDFADFAAQFPISNFCAILGTSTAGIPDIRPALESQSLVLSLNRELLPAMLAGYEVMTRYLDELIAERERGGGEAGFLDTLLEVRDAGQIDDAELRHLLVVLFNAGYDTSKNMITLIMNMMLSHPEAWERCATDYEHCVRVVEEMFRHTSTGAVLRKVAEDFDYDGVRFPKGAMLFFGNMIAGRDPRAFADPERFDPDRIHEVRHVAFGRGAHMCVGQHLARAQITEGIHLIAQRITRPRLVGDIVWRKGVRALPIEFVPGQAVAAMAD